MRNLLAFLAAALIAFLGLGWYLGWYSFKPVSTAEGHKSFNIDINADKIKSDVAKGVQKGEEKIHDVLDKEKKGDDGAAVKTTGAEKASPTLKIAPPRIIFGAEEELRPSPPGQVPQ